MKYKIELTEKQQTFILRFLNREWDEEIDYQRINQSLDIEYLEDLLELYTALLGKPNGLIQALCNKDDIEMKLKELNELKEEIQ